MPGAILSSSEPEHTGTGEEPRIIIIGGGPTGLGAALRLHELGYRNWTVYEKEDEAGGLSGSTVDEKGFTWDYGGHILFSGFSRINAILDGLGDDFFIDHERKSYVRIMGRFIPFPFQLHTDHLPHECRQEIKRDAATDGRLKDPPENFRQWLENRFGPAQCRLFFYPYNSKLWGAPLESMSWSWVRERISTPDQVKKGRSWGPNNRFRYPARGGMGGLFKRLAAKFPMRVRYGSEIKEIDITAKKITCGNGVTDAFDFLVSSMPLNTLVGQALSEAPETIRRHAAELRWNSCRITGLGFETPVENHVSWAYFPESFFPFYRVTALASYSPDIVPGADISAFSSFMCETTARDGKAADKRLFHDAVSASGMSRRKLPHPLSFHTIFLPYAYPVPTLERDRHLAAIQEFLESRDIYSRGRFGGWKYEAGNMDHSMMQGMEAIDRILLGRREEVYRTG